jgi:hypothetical protein
MFRLLFLTIIIFSSLSLHAYQKKIVLESFTTQKRALIAKDSISKKSPELYDMSKEYDFEFSVKESGKYHILVAEVFRDKETILKAVKEARKVFKGAYINQSTQNVQEKQEKQEKKVASSPIKEIKPIIIAEENAIKEEKQLLEVEEISSEMAKIEPKPLVKKDTKVIAMASQTPKSKEEIHSLNNSELPPEVMKPSEVESAEDVVEKLEKTDEFEKNEQGKNVEQSSIQNKESNEIVIETIEQNDEVKVEESEVESGFFRWTHLVVVMIVILLGALIFAGIKFKRIYDGY